MMKQHLTHDIDWSMLDKSRYIPLSLLSTFTRSFTSYIHLLLFGHDLQVQRTILDLQRHVACINILLFSYEGFRSLYKGFLVYNCQLLPGLIYITAFESTRAHANTSDEKRIHTSGNRVVR